MTSISTLVIFRVKSGKESDFEAAIDRVLKSTSHAGGLIRYDRYRDPADRQRYVLHEIWEGSQLLDEHVASDHFAEFVEETTVLLEKKEVFILNPF